MRFSTDHLPAADRLTQWRDVVGRTLTGCTPSPLEGGDMKVDFAMVGGSRLRIVVTNLHHIRNNRDADCLRDRDEDLIFFSMLRGRGTIAHNQECSLLRGGDGVLCKFDRTLDTHWPDARAMLIRVAREELRGVEPERVTGLLQPRSSALMRLLQSYARTAWREGVRGGALLPIAERHICELLGTLCASSAEEAVRVGRPALGAARIAAMREAIAGHAANPCLTMREVAASVGLSERSGHIAFEKAQLSFTDELHATRLDRALERLCSGTERVLDVAYAVGFSDASHFHRLFKQRFGATPGEARLMSAREPEAGKRRRTGGDAVSYTSAR